MKTKQQTKSTVLQARNNLLRAIVKVNTVLLVTLLFLLIAHVSRAGNVKHGTKSVLAGPTAENALAAERQFSDALLANDPDAMARILDDDFALVNPDGSIRDGFKAGWIAMIKSGDLLWKTRVVSEPRVRIYGNIALVTTHSAVSGMLRGKPFEGKERWTNVFIWRKGAWKVVLSQLTLIKEN